jgi:hypothetical protein
MKVILGLCAIVALSGCTNKQTKSTEREPQQVVGEVENTKSNQLMEKLSKNTYSSMTFTKDISDDHGRAHGMARLSNPRTGLGVYLKCKQAGEYGVLPNVQKIELEHLGQYHSANKRTILWISSDDCMKIVSLSNLVSDEEPLKLLWYSPNRTMTDWRIIGMKILGKELAVTTKYYTQEAFNQLLEDTDSELAEQVVQETSSPQYNGSVFSQNYISGQKPVIYDDNYYSDSHQNNPKVSVNGRVSVDFGKLFGKGVKGQVSVGVGQNRPHYPQGGHHQQYRCEDCSAYGCWVVGGGCNAYGCWYPGGKCGPYSCVKEAPKKPDACR